MSRLAAAMLATVCFGIGGCSHTDYIVRPIPRIAADNVGQPVRQLVDAFGTPRKIDTTTSKQTYVWFIEQKPPGAPAGFHGCEMEVTVDIRTEHVLGYSLSNVGWARCREVERKIHVAER